MTFKQSIDKIISEIIHNNINSWFLDWEKSNSNSFQNELKVLLFAVFSKLSMGIKCMNKIQFLTCINQKLKNHLRHYRNIEGSVQEIAEIPIESYLKLSWKILRYSLPSHDLESKVLVSFLNEILAGTILPLLIRKISNPHFLNTLIIHALSVSDEGQQAKVNDLSLLDILNQGHGLLEFIQFLKDQKAYPLAQFYYAVDSYTKIFNYIQGKGQSDFDKSTHALEIFRIYFSSKADPQTRIYLHGHDKLVRKTLQNIHDNPDAHVFDPILNCILGLLEDRYLPVFRKSKYYKDYINSFGNSPGLRRKRGFRSLETEIDSRYSHILEKLDLRIKGKIDVLSLQEDLDFLQSKINETMDQNLLVELENEKFMILKKIQNIELGTNLNNSIPQIIVSQEDTKKAKENEQEDTENLCVKSLSKALSCVGHSFKRSMGNSKSKFRSKSQDPYRSKVSQISDSKIILQNFNSLHRSISEETISVISEDKMNSDRDNELQVVKYSGLVGPKEAKVKLEEMNFVLDCTCEVIEEVFHLSAPTNWLRIQGLYLVKSLIRNTYGYVISEMIQKVIAEFFNEESICTYLDNVREYIWPSGDYSDLTESEKESTKDRAWNLLMRENSPHETSLGIGINRIQKIVGKYNTIIGLTRLFNMLQYEGLNRILMFSFLEELVEHVCIQ